MRKEDCLVIKIYPIVEKKKKKREKRPNIKNIDKKRQIARKASHSEECIKHKFCQFSVKQHIYEKNIYINLKYYLREKSILVSKNRKFYHL